MTYVLQLLVGVAIVLTGVIVTKEYDAIKASVLRLLRRLRLLRLPVEVRWLGWMRVEDAQRSVHTASTGEPVANLPGSRTAHLPDRVGSGPEIAGG